MVERKKEVLAEFSTGNEEAATGGVFMTYPEELNIELVNASDFNSYNHDVVFASLLAAISVGFWFQVSSWGAVAIASLIFSGLTLYYGIRAAKAFKKMKSKRKKIPLVTNLPSSKMIQETLDTGYKEGVASQRKLDE